MHRRSLFVTVLSMVAGILSGCASAPSGGSLADYVAVGYVNITTTCGGGYQIYRQPVNGRMLVSAYAASEMRQSFCESWRGESPISAATGVRHEDAALEYIAKTPSMKGCILTSGIEITRLHSEFTLDCPVHPVPAIAAKA
jgi:hypothetical protein